MYDKRCFPERPDGMASNNDAVRSTRSRFRCRRRSADAHDTALIDQSTRHSWSV